jgi:hypothetical protein
LNHHNQQHLLKSVGEQEEKWPRLPLPEFKPNDGLLSFIYEPFAF